MQLYEQWKELAYKERTPEEYDAFWSDYLPKEQEVYTTLLQQHGTVTEGTISDLAATFNLEPVVFVGFLDGINTSLTTAIDLEPLTEDDTVRLSIDFPLLYHNMLEATAEWLYTLPEWDDILTPEERKGIKKAYNQSKIVVKDRKIGRNEPCPCGSGKKYKQCCLKNA